MKIICLIAFTWCVFPLLGVAQDRYLLVLLHKNANAEKISKEESAKLMEGHMSNINSLASEGKLLAAGPFDGGGGLFIFNTTSREEANSWLVNDPGIQAKRWNIEMLPYRPRYRGICPVKEPYEMTKYNFVRFDVIVSKSTASNFPEIIKRHDEYLKELQTKGPVVTEAIFSERDGGILIVAGELQQEVIENDPAVMEGLIQFEIKKLNIAKGSFCE